MRPRRVRTGTLERMGGRGILFGGLAAGAATGLVILALLVALLPPPATPVVAAPNTPSAASSSPGPSAAGSAGPSGSPDPGGAAFHLGEPAPALRVAQLGGGAIDLANLRGKPVWVNFMATWCPPCRDELPIMNSFMVRYADTGLVVIAVDVREDVSTVNAFAQEIGIRFPVGLDEDGAAQQAWGAYALPVHFWIDADGIVRDGALGGVGPDLMAAALEKSLPGVDVKP